MALIPGTNVSARIAPFDTADTFATHDAKWGRDGYRSVADLTERDAITEQRQKVGMLVYVQSNDTIYKLTSTSATLSSANWEELVLGGGTSGTAGVAFVNDISGSVNLIAGDSISITESGQNITISISGDFATKSEVASISGDLANDIQVNSVNIANNLVEINLLQSETQYLSGAIDTNTSSISVLQSETQYLSGAVDAIDVSNFITETEVASISGDLQLQITNNDVDISNLQSETQYLSGAIDAIEQESTVVQGDGDRISAAESPANTWTVSFDDTGLATDASVASISGDLQLQITNNDVDISNLQSETQYLSGAIDSIDVSNFITETEVASISGDLQTQISANDTDITAISGSLGDYVQKTGDTMTGPLVINYDAGTALEVNADGDARIRLNNIPGGEAYTELSFAEAGADQIGIYWGDFPDSGSDTREQFSTYDYMTGKNFLYYSRNSDLLNRSYVELHANKTFLVGDQIVGLGFTGSSDNVFYADGADTIVNAYQENRDFDVYTENHSSALRVKSSSDPTLEFVGVGIDNDATSSSDGAFRVDGGVGIAKSLYVGSDLEVSSGDVTVQTLSGGIDNQIVTVSADGTLQNSGETISSLLSDYDTRFVNISGDTMTGNLDIEFAGPGSRLNLLRSDAGDAIRSNLGNNNTGWTITTAGGVSETAFFGVGNSDGIDGAKILEGGATGDGLTIEKNTGDGYFSQDLEVQGEVVIYGSPSGLSVRNGFAEFRNTYTYFGANGSNDSWRFSRSDNDFAIAQRKANSWTNKVIIADTTGDVTVQTLSGGIDDQIVTVSADGTLQNSGATLDDYAPASTDLVTTVSTSGGNNLLDNTTAEVAEWLVKVESGTNLRLSKIIATTDGSTAVWSEYSTDELGDTSPISLSVDFGISGLRLFATSSDLSTWTITSYRQFSK